MQQTAGRLTAVTIALAATVLSGCSATDGLVSSSVALPASGTSATQAPSSAGAASNKLLVTAAQRRYLDALTAGGVHPSSELMALSIGSYVCQARAAGQSSAAVWDFVHPMVTTDVHNAHAGGPVPAPSEVDAATASYIRIATDRLC